MKLWYPQKIAISNLIDPLMKLLSNKWKNTKALDIAKQEIISCDQIDIPKWEESINKDLESYFQILDQNTEKLKKQSMEEVSHIFKYKSIKEFTEKKNYITELYNQIESEYNKIDQDIKNGDSSKVVKRRKHLEN